VEVDASLFGASRLLSRTHVTGRFRLDDLNQITASDHGRSANNIKITASRTIPYYIDIDRNTIMADVRSMLRNERASRRINHPQATYSTTGTLVCLVCHIQLKSESFWNKHLRSGQHAMRLQRIRDGTLGRPPGAPPPPPEDPEDDNSTNGTNPASNIDLTASSAPASTSQSAVGNSNGSKKRKADSDDDGEELRKRTKAGDNGFFDQSTANPNGPSLVPPHVQPRPLENSQTKASRLPAEPTEAEFATSHTPPPDPSDDQVDEAEWAAFERDIATPTSSPPNKPSAFTAAATITAAPLTAAEIAAQSREQASLQAKEMREEEVEGEKEDAARRLEEEFEEMAELEERVRRLREKREGLRVRRDGGNGDGGRAEREAAEEADVESGGEGGSDEEDDDDDDEADEWGVWAR